MWRFVSICLNFLSLKMSVDCSNSAALLIGGTIMAGLVSLAALNKPSQQPSTSSTSSISSTNTLAASKAFLLQICSQNPGKLVLLAKMLTTPFSGGTAAQIEVLTEFKRFVVQKIFFIERYNAFTFSNEQFLFSNSNDNSVLIAFIAKCAYELQYKNFL